MKDNQFNRFQYSEFTGEKGQLVFRADTYDELVAYCGEAGITLPRKQIVTQQPQSPATTPASPISKPISKPMSVGEFEQKCEKCGSKKILSKKGNMVCSDFCWTKK